MDKMEQVVAELLAKDAIRTVMASYARAVDRRDWAGVAETYHVDAYDDHGDYKGDIPGFVAWASQRHETVEQSMHFLGNQHIEMLDADRALVETYCIVNQRYGPEAMETILLWLGESPDMGPNDRISADLYCRYVDLFEQRNGEWRIAHRTLVMEEVRSCSVKVELLKPVWALATRDANDPLWTRTRALGLSRSVPRPA